MIHIEEQSYIHKLSVIYISFQKFEFIYMPTTFLVYLYANYIFCFLIYAKALLIPIPLYLTNMLSSILKNILDAFKF